MAAAGSGTLWRKLSGPVSLHVGTAVLVGAGEHVEGELERARCPVHCQSPLHADDRRVNDAAVGAGLDRQCQERVVEQPPHRKPEADVAHAAGDVDVGTETPAQLRYRVETVPSVLAVDGEYGRHCLDAIERKST